MPFELHGLHQGGGDFLDGFGGGVEPAHSFPAHQPLRLIHFPATVIERSVLAVGPALLPDLGEALGGDGEAEELVPVRKECPRQLAALEILGNQRIVGGLDAEQQEQDAAPVLRWPACARQNRRRRTPARRPWRPA